MFAIARVNGHGHMNCYRSRLAQSMNTIVALFLYGGIPPAGKMKHVGGGREREAYPGGLGAENKNVETIIGVEMPLEAIDDSLTLRNGGVAIYAGSI